jgi:hypothetical protein
VHRAEPDAEVEAAWAAEVDRRVRSIDSGEVELIRWEQARESSLERSRACGASELD